jgi:hypothetical protein
VLIVRSRNGIAVRLTEERWRNVVDRPAVVAPLLAAVAGAVTFLACLLIRGMDPEKARRGYRWGQLGSGAPVTPDNEIAEELYISLYTVKNYVSSILRKLGLKSRREIS